MKSQIPISILQTKIIANISVNTQQVSPTLLVAIGLLILQWQYYNTAILTFTTILGPFTPWVRPLPGRGGGMVCACFVNNPVSSVLSRFHKCDTKQVKLFCSRSRLLTFHYLILLFIIRWFYCKFNCSVVSLCKRYYTPWVKKTVPLYIRSYLWQMLADFQNSFTVVFSEKFATKPMPHYPPHLCRRITQISVSYLSQGGAATHRLFRAQRWHVQFSQFYRRRKRNIRTGPVNHTTVIHIIHCPCYNYKIPAHLLTASTYEFIND